MGTQYMIKYKKTSGREPTRGPRVPYCYSSALQNGGEYPSGRKYVPYNEMCSNVHQIGSALCLGLC